MRTLTGIGVGRARDLERSVTTPWYGSGDIAHFAPKMLSRKPMKPWAGGPGRSLFGVRRGSSAPGGVDGSDAGIRSGSPLTHIGPSIEIFDRINYPATELSEHWAGAIALVLFQRTR